MGVLRDDLDKDFEDVKYLEHHRFKCMMNRIAHNKDRSAPPIRLCLKEDRKDEELIMK